MNERTAIATLLGCLLFAVGAGAQTTTVDPIKLRSLRVRYEELAVQYQKRCDLKDYDMDIELLRIEQGAGLSEGMVAPLTMGIARVIQEILNRIKDDTCRRAKEYSDLAESIDDMLK